MLTTEVRLPATAKLIISGSTNWPACREFSDLSATLICHSAEESNTTNTTQHRRRLDVKMLRGRMDGRTAVLLLFVEHETHFANPLSKNNGSVTTAKESFGNIIDDTQG